MIVPTMSRCFRGEGGGIGMRVALIGATLLIVAGAIFWQLQNFQTNQETNQRKALQICEYGLQLALEKVIGEPDWESGFGKTPCEGGWYDARLKRSPAGDSLTVVIEASGHSGPAARKKRCVVVRSVSGADTTWSQEYID